jgi:hypothetical protein
MVSKMCRIVSMIVLASFAFSSAAWAATCSNASLSGTYGFLHDGTDSNGAPATAAVSQVRFDATTGTFTGETTASHDGVISTEPLTGTYAVASNCTGTGNPTGGNPFSFVVTSTGFLAVHLFSEGFAVREAPRPAPMPELKVVLGLKQAASSSQGRPPQRWLSSVS